MKNKKEVILVIFAILLTIFYFTYAVTITWDSAHYMSYVNILERTLPFSSWDVVRGPVFPIIIYLSNFMFGKTVQGLLINSYIYYIVMLLFSYKILDELLPSTKKKNKIIMFSILSIILNPIIYGYYHVLLTEFVAMTLAVLSCYLSYKWLYLDFKNKKKFIIYTVLFVILTLFGWFLKQPYISTTLFPLLIAFVIRLFKKEKVKKKLYGVSTIIICAVFLVISIGTWNGLLEYKGVDSDTTRNPTTSLGNTLITAIKYFEIEKCDENCDVNYVNADEFLSDSEKNEIIDLIENDDRTFVIINTYNKDSELIDKTFINTDADNMSTFGSVGFIIGSFIRHPLLMSNAYLSNYLAISNIYATTNENSTNYETIEKIDLDYVNEISSIGMKPYSYTSNIFYITDDAYQRVVNYEQVNHAPKILNYAMIILSKVSIVLFKLLFIALPFTLIVSIVKRVKTKNRKYDMLIILFGYGMLHMILHTVTGAVIDRYAMPAYITTFLGVIILFSLLSCKERSGLKWRRKKY